MILVVHLYLCLQETFSKTSGGSFCKKIKCKCHLSDVERCMVQSAGHQQYHTIHLWKDGVGNYFLLYCLDSHKPINGSYWYC
jgi:hypothetical protein